MYARDAVGERLSTMSVGKSHEGVRYRTVSKLEPRSNHLRGNVLEDEVSREYA